MEILNKKANLEYKIEETIEAGIRLVGAEVKAVKLGHADLTGSHARIIGSEAYVVGAKIFPYKYARPEAYDESRTRKLLLHKAQIISLKSKLDTKGMALVPLKMYVKHEYVKILLGIGKGKKTYEKRASIKKKEQAREIEREFGQNI